jgi:hypothetical protein
MTAEPASVAAIIPVNTTPRPPCDSQTFTGRILCASMMQKNEPAAAMFQHRRK